MRTRWIAATAVLLASSSSASARADEAAALPAPSLTLSLAAATDGGPWRIRVENTGDVPVRLAADPRLLFLDVTPPDGWVDPTAKKPKPGAKAPKKVEAPKPIRCILPAGARPSTDAGQELVIPAKRSWSSIVDPLFYCFGARERAALVTGAIVKAGFGWPPPTPKPGAKAPKKVALPIGPFVADPVGAALGRVSPAKELEAAPITLSSGVDGKAASAAPPSSIAISMPAALDVARGVEIPVTVTIKNEGDRAAVLLFRPEMLIFNVAGPAGSVTCGSTREVSSPIRELFATVGVGQHASLTALITALCPSDTFDDPGLYRITPVLDTSEASGQPIGLRTWDGVATGKTPMLLRVRTPRRMPVSPKKPSLDSSP